MHQESRSVQAFAGLSAVIVSLGSAVIMENIANAIVARQGLLDVDSGSGQLQSFALTASYVKAYDTADAAAST